jgi:hypothetical protein
VRMVDSVTLCSSCGAGAGRLGADSFFLSETPRSMIVSSLSSEYVDFRRDRKDCFTGFGGVDDMEDPVDGDINIA